MNFFVVADVHGHKDRLDLLLKHWNPDNEKLIFVGDLMDKGPDSLGVILTAMKLKEEYGAEVIGGNHEDLFLNFLRDYEDPFDAQFYFNQGGDRTLYSFFDKNVSYLYTPEKIVQLLNTGFANEIDFIKNLPDYYETEHFLFVHAGVDFQQKHWKDTKPADFRWIREKFIYKPNTTDKTIVFGHTQTRLINKDQKRDVWFSPCGTKIGIDGGVFEKTGILHGLKITDNQYNVIAV